MTLTNFTSFLNGLTGSFSGFPSFSDLSSDSWSKETVYSPENFSISVFAFMLDTPQAEYLSDDSPIDTSFKNFHKDNPEWLVGSNIKSGIPSVDISANHYQMNFRYISTPETTYALVYAYDIRNPKECPVKAVETMRDMFEDYSDNVIVKKNAEATAGSFKTELKNGINNYRYVMFSEFSHGSSGYITLKGGLRKNDIVDILKTAKCRVFGMFDSCHSESMINEEKIESNCFASAASESYTLNPPYSSISSVAGTNSLRTSAGNHEEQLADSIIDSLNEYFSSLGAAATVNDDDKPLIMLWSSTGARHYGWYYPRSGTVFAGAVADAYNISKEKRVAAPDGIWTLTQTYGKSHTSKGKKSIQYCCPCLRTFEPDKDSDPENKLLTLIGLS